MALYAAIRDDRRAQWAPATDDRRPAAELVEVKGRRSAHSKEATLCGVASLRGLHYGVSEESQRRSVLQRLAPNKRCGQPHDNRCGLTLFHGSVNVMSAFRESAYDSTAKRLKTEFLSKLLSGEFDKFSEKLGFCSGLAYGKGKSRRVSS